MVFATTSDLVEHFANYKFVEAGLVRKRERGSYNQNLLSHFDFNFCVLFT